MFRREAYALALVLLIVVAGTAIYLKTRPEPKFADAPPFFYELNPGSISHISIHTGGDSQTFQWDASTSSWVFGDGSQVDPNRWGGMPVLLSGPRIERQLPEVTNLAQYGLAPPATTVTIGLDDGTQFVVLIGSKTPSGSAHYVMQSDTTSVLLVDSAWGDVIEGMVTSPPLLQSRTPTPTY